MRGSQVIVLVLQYGTVVLGHFWGVSRYPDRPPSMHTACAVFACLLMLVGVFTSRAARPINGVKHRTSVCAACLLYSVGAILFEPFYKVYGPMEVFLAICVLVPLILSIGYLVRGSAWVSVAGVVLFVTTSVAMLTSNARITRYGSGFFSYWIS